LDKGYTFKRAKITGYGSTGPIYSSHSASPRQIATYIFDPDASLELFVVSMVKAIIERKRMPARNICNLILIDISPKKYLIH
jgi:hypothetical protein